MSAPLQSPFVVRLAGLPVRSLAALESELPALAAELRRQGTELEQLRGRLVDALFAKLLEFESDDRRLPLAIKRDCHNGRSLARHRSQPGWPAVDAASGGLAGELLALEAELAARQALFAERYAEVRRGQSAALFELAGDASLRRGVALSSAELIESTDRRQQKAAPMAARKERKAEQSWLRYLTRAAFKLSPYSTLSRLALGDAEPGAKGCELQPGPWRERALLRAKRYIAEELRDLFFLLPPCRDLIPRMLNPTVETLEDGRIRFLTADRRTLENGDELRYRQAALVRMGLDPVALGALRELLASGPLPLSQLQEPWRRRFAGSDTADFLEPMADLGLLVPVYPWKGNCARLELELARYLGGLDRQPEMAAIAALLLEATELEDGFASSPNPAGTIRRINELLGEAWLLADRQRASSSELKRLARERNDLYEDVFMTAGAAGDEQPLLRVGAAEVGDFFRETALLVDLAELFNLRHDFLHQIADLARERFPGRQEVGVLELFSAAQGWWKEFTKFVAEGQNALDWGNSFEKAMPDGGKPLTELRQAAWAAMAAAVRPADEAAPLAGNRLDTAALAAFFEKVPARYRPLVGGSFFVQPLAGTDGADGASWVLNRLFEGSGRYSSRYTSVMPERLGDAFCERTAAGSRFAVGGEPAELIDIACPQGDTLNIRKVMTPRVIECAGEHATAPSERVLTAADLRVRLDAVPTLRDAEGRRLVPAHLGGVNLRFMPPLVKFISYFGVGELRPLPWKRQGHRVGDVDIFPRLQAGKVLLLRRRFKVPTAELRLLLAAGKADAEAFLELDAWRTARELPARVFLIEPIRDSFANRMYKPQYLDFSSPLCLDLFRQVVEKGPDFLELEEVAPTPEMAPADGRGERWAVELQLDRLAMGEAAAAGAPAAGASKGGPMGATTDDRIIGFDIYHFIDLADDEGRAWNREFQQRGYLALRDRLNVALKLMHERQVGRAKEVLDEVAAGLEQAGGDDLSMRQVVGRWFHGIWAYYHYLVGDFAEAGRELDRAHVSISSAIERHWFLTSLASHCMDLRIQQARIERNRGNWQEMAENLELSRQMIFGSSPFCVLRNGKPITLDIIAQHFADLDLGEEEKQATSGFFDEEGKRKDFDRHAKQMYALPGLVIQYP